VDAQGLQPATPFFSLSDALREAEETALRDPIAIQRLKESVPELLLDSVRHHLVSDVPVGIFLSSGLDSSALVSLAKQAGATTLQAVTLGFQEFKNRPEDETPLAARVAAHFGADHQVRWLDRQGFSEHLDRALQAMDQPSVDGLNTYFVAKAASEAGMKVALSGLGGDELFGGYNSYRQVPRMARILGPLRAFPGLGTAFRALARPLTGRRISPKWASLLEYGPRLTGAYFLRRALFMPWEFEGLGAPVDLVRGWEELDLTGRLERSIQGLTTERGRLIALEAGWYMRNQLLRDSDWAAMAHGLELRTPLVDATLLRQLAPALVSSAPPDRRQVVGALAAPPPPEVLARPKTGFSMPIRTWVEEIRGRRGPDRGIRGWGRFLASALPGTPTLARLRADIPGARRVLIFRVGSLGDTVVALPSFHLIAKAFPQAERWVLTNFPEHRKAPPLSAILGESGLVHGYLEYPPQASALRKLIRTRRQLRSFRPDLVVYLMPVRTPQQLRRDRLFFRLCGVSQLVGLPETERQRQGGWNLETAQWTHETERLLSTLNPLGSLDLRNPGVWDFRFTRLEEDRARQATAALPADHPVLALSLGTKQSINEWGLEKWRELTGLLPGLLPGWSLMLLGAPEDREPSEALARAWPGPAVNLCGTLQPRESAAAVRRAALFLGQDSGPMHLAAAVGVPCVAIFSARNWPGEWFPFGEGHHVIRHEVPCAGCRLTRCLEEDRRCIVSITVNEVIEAVSLTLARVPQHQKARS
jgi:ADP-heptose:LPS heptosyltransferase